MLGMLVFLARKLTDVDKHPTDERYFSFLLVLVLFAATLLLSYLVGWTVFRRRYPDKAFLPPEEEEDVEAGTQDSRVRTWIVAAAVVLGVIAGIVAYHVMRNA